MAGSCGQTLRIQPTVAPDACNALTQTATGLLVPSTVVEGVSATAPAPAGTERSVAVDVTAPAPGDCPQTWEVGARLAAPSGAADLTANVNLDPLASGVWADTTLELVLPEAGTYMVSGKARAALSAPSGSNGWVVTRIIRTDTLAVLDEAMVLLVANTNAGGAIGHQATAPLIAPVTVAGPTTIRLQVQRTWQAIVSTGAVLAGVSSGTTRLAYWKVAD